MRVSHQERSSPIPHFPSALPEARIAVTQVESNGHRPLSAGKLTVTTHALKATGAIKWMNEAKRFGLVTRDDGGDDLFASFPQPIQSDEPRDLKIAQRVSYDIEPGRHGGQAVNVRMIS